MNNSDRDTAEQAKYQWPVSYLVWFGLIYDMLKTECLCPSKIVESLTPNVIIFGGGTFGK